jgi:N-ethylmaleimide reductase
MTRHRASYGKIPGELRRPVKNRARILLEIIKAIEAHWPLNRIGVRLSPTNPYQGMSDSDPASHFAQIAGLLDPLGLAYLHVVEPLVQPEGYPVTAAAIRLAFTGALILAGSFKRADAEQVLAKGKADLIAFGQAFIASPDLPMRWRLNTTLNSADKSTYCTQGAKGYTDYPSLELVQG